MKCVTDDRRTKKWRLTGAQSILVCILLALTSVAHSGCNGTEPETIRSSDSGYKVAASDAKPSSDSGPSALNADAFNAAAGAPSIPLTAIAEAASQPPSLPSEGVNPTLMNEQQLNSRSFMRVREPAGNEPSQLKQFLAEVDSAIRDLVESSNNPPMEEKQFIEIAKRLGNLKRTSGQALAASATASPEDKKLGWLAQLEGLSHVAGLRDVEAAKQLEALATELANSTDADLSHQSRLVLFGFRLNALQEGQEKDPLAIVKELDGLFARKEDRGYPEFMVLQQTAMILQSMGFADAFKAVIQRIGKEYRDSPDTDMSMMAWSIETNESPHLIKFTDELRSIFEGKAADAQPLVAAATGFFEAFPSAMTLAHIAKQALNLEYSGNVEICKQMVAFLKPNLEKISAAPIAAQIADMIASHEKRIGCVGQPLDLSGLIAFDGQPFDWSQYRGKVVLVDFWATWCGPCLQEIPNVQKAHSALADQGFDVVGINLDDRDLVSVEDFVMKKRFPWRTVRSSDPNAIGFQTAIAMQLGIKAIPFVVLVDKAGKVAGIHVRGDKIVPAVQRLLASPLAQ